MAVDGDPMPVEQTDIGGELAVASDQLWPVEEARDALAAPGVTWQQDSLADVPRPASYVVLRLGHGRQQFTPAERRDDSG